VTAPLGIAPELLTAAAVGLPLLCAAALALPGRRRVPPHLVPWAALPAVMAAWLLPDGSTALFQWMLLSTRLGLDATGRTFLFFTSVLWLLSGVYGTGYLSADRRRPRFFFFYGLAMSGNLGVILAQDLVGFYAFFALMSFSSYGLVVHTGDPEARRAGRIYLILVVVGEIALFSGLAVLAVAAGSLEIGGLREGAIPSGAMVLICMGFGIKAGALPLHVWLPLAHSAAPTPASAVLSGAMIKAGLLGWLRFTPIAVAASPAWGAVFVLAGAAAAFYAVAVGSTQSHPKTVLAYSSISQMGLITIGVGLSLLSPEVAAAGLPAVALYALHHGFAKGALFLTVGILQAVAPGSRVSRLAWAGLILAALSLAGAPLTSGAVSKGALKTAVALTPQAWHSALSVLLPLASIATTVLMGRLAYLMAHRAPGSGRPGAGMWIAWLMMLAPAALLLWVFPAAEAPSVAAVGEAAWPVAAGGVLTALVWAAGRHNRRFSVPQVPSGDMVVAYAALSRLAARAAAAVGKRLSGGVPWVRVPEELRRQSSAFAAAAESALGNWQVSGLLFLIAIVGILLQALFAR
jgi:formate hydrogenlyase subunit 3/multisubunit Na+/H+ antiporter MnhD subunit